MRTYFLHCILSLVCVFSLTYCTPKTSETAVETEIPADSVEVVTEQLSDCKKYGDSKYEEDALNAYAIYSNFLNVNKFEEAHEYWETVYTHAPAGYGKNYNIFMDGVVIYTNFLRNASGEQERQKYTEKIMTLYDEAMDCFPNKVAELKGRKGFDLYYNFPDLAEDIEKFRLLQSAVDTLGNNTPVFVINPMTALLVNLYLNDELEQSEASEYAMKLADITEFNHAKDSDDESWNIVKEFAMEQIANLEGEENFYPCTYYKEKYYPIYLRSKNNCDSVQFVFGKLNWGGCDTSSADMQEIKSYMDENCEVVAASGSSASKAYKALRTGNYNKAVNEFKKAVENTDDTEKKAQYNLLIAKIYYAHLKSYSQSRSYALKAANLKSNWGDPYMLIGNLYASSGPLCGSGRGWNSQVVTWVAIDMWNKAKSVDSSVSGKANTLINRYRQFMPSKGDIFQRNLKEGDSFKVGCWIQRTTTIRAAG